MSTCPTCKATLSCSCQLRTLSNGGKACNACFQAEQSKINVANARLKQQELEKQNSPQS